MAVGDAARRRLLGPPRGPRAPTPHGARRTRGPLRRVRRRRARSLLPRGGWRIDARRRRQRPRLPAWPDLLELACLRDVLVRAFDVSPEAALFLAPTLWATRRAASRPSRARSSDATAAEAPRADFRGGGRGPGRRRGREPVASGPRRRDRAHCHDLRCCAYSRAFLARDGPPVVGAIDAVSRRRAVRSGAIDRRPTIAAPARPGLPS